MLPSMSMPQEYLRSPELMSVGDTALVVVDVQERLIPAIAGGSRVVWNVRRLVDVAKLLDMPVLATEQYPAGLGRSVPELAARLGEVPSKLSFSCLGCPAFLDALQQLGSAKLLVCGVEAHVCVQQTVLDLIAGAWRTYVAVDAVGSRQAADYETALRRMEMAGATLTTTEAALFEWCQAAGTPQFKQISAVVKEKPPAPSASGG